MLMNFVNEIQCSLIRLLRLLHFLVHHADVYHADDLMLTGLTEACHH
jgi:hypothetical protein